MECMQTYRSYLGIINLLLLNNLKYIIYLFVFHNNNQHLKNILQNKLKNEN